MMTPISQKNNRGLEGDKFFVQVHKYEMVKAGALARSAKHESLGSSLLCQTSSCNLNVNSSLQLFLIDQ